MIRTPSRSIVDFVSLVSVTLLIQLLTVVSGPLIARMLHVSGRGEFAFITAAAFIAAQIVAGGVSISIAQIVSRHGQPAWGLLRGAMGTWWLIMGAGSVAAAVVTGFQLQELPLPQLTLATIALTTGTCLFAIVLAMLNGEQHAPDLNLMRMVSVITYVGAVVALYFTAKPGPLVIVGLMVTTQALGTLYGVARLRSRRRLGTEPVSREEFGRLTREHVVTGANAMVLGLDQLIIGVVLGTASLGLYAVGGTIANVTGIVLRSISDFLMPKLIREPDGHARDRLRKRALSLTAAVAVVMGLGLQVVAGPLLIGLFGEEFREALPATRLLIVAWMFLGFRRPLQAVLQADGAGRSASRIEGACTLLLICCVAAGCRWNGPTGAALGLLVAAATCVAWLLWRVRRTRRAPSTLHRANTT